MGNCCKGTTEYAQLSWVSHDQDAPMFTLEGRQCWCKIHPRDVYDGDTAKATFVLPGMGVRRFKCRLDGYDSPEMKPLKSTPNREAIKASAKEARDHLISMVAAKQNQLVWCHCGRFDKYGRVLVTLYKGPTWFGKANAYIDSINQKMIADGHGCEYHGGTKGGNVSGSREQ
jgi:endonuclease YncB( thermonuclease family)